MSQLLAVDIGGTFVDSITYNNQTGNLQVEKTSTTPADPLEGVIDGIEKLEINLDNVETFTHGTTLGINAVLERKGATTGLITNEGFEDILEIGRTNLTPEAMFDINYEKPDILVPRQRRKGVQCRVDTSGKIIESLDRTAVQEIVQEIVEEKETESIAVCFLHSYQNNRHEQEVKRIIKEEYPEISVSVSSNITQEYREYERTSTVVLDAYIKPIFESYVGRLEEYLVDNGFNGSLFFTQSGGGATTPGEVRKAPVKTCLSGPAGGITGTSVVSNNLARSKLIALDMGGTSLDVCVIEDESPTLKHESSIAHMPVMIPVYDIRTIGAGGGSVAWLDGEILKVGPESAGADPGPICYGQGGEAPTVTDAALMLGYISPRQFLGGKMELYTSEARTGMLEEIAEPLGMTVSEASTGVFDIMVAKSTGALREITVEKGLDPREFSILAYGGAGPMFAPLLARETGAKEVIVPSTPAVFSALGMLMTDITYDFSQTKIVDIEDSSIEELDAVFESLKEAGKETLQRDGFDQDAQRYQQTVEMRYVGQEHTVEIPTNDIEYIDELHQRFENQHDSLYGHVMDDPSQIVTFRVHAIGKLDNPEFDVQEGEEQSPEPTKTRLAYCFARDEEVKFSVFKRKHLGSGNTIKGPAIVQEPTSTTVIHSDQTARIDAANNIIIETTNE